MYYLYSGVNRKFEVQMKAASKRRNSGMTVGQILKSCGGHMPIAIKMEITVFGVAKWVARGIPVRHWGDLMEMNPALTPDILYHANKDMDV